MGIGFRASVVAAICLVGGSASGETFRYFEREMALSPNPVHELSMADVRLNELLHASLWAPNIADIPQEVLVSEASLDESGRELTISLKAATWSDGQPISAEDVVFTLDAYRDPASRSLDRARWDFIESATVVDASTLRIRLARRFREVPKSQLYLKIIPKHAFDGPGIPRSHKYRKNPVTSGAFQFDKKDYKSWSLTAYDKSLNASRLNSVLAQEVPEMRTQAEMMVFGHGHAMIEVDSQQRAELDADRCCVLKSYPSKSWWYLGMNNAHPALASQGVRKAISSVLNRQEALELIGEGELISGPFTLSSRYYNHDVPVPDKDLAAATELLQQAGFTKESGAWTKDGVAPTFRMFYDESLRDQGQMIATNLVSQLRRFGLDVSDPAAIGKDTWEDRVLTKRDFDLVLGVWSFDVNEDIGQLFGKGRMQNFIGYSDPRTDQLLQGAYASQDPSEQRAFMQALHQRLADTTPYAFLWSLRQYTALSSRVTGAHIQPYYFFTQFPSWELKEE